MAMTGDNLLRVLLSQRAKLHAYIWTIVRDEHVAEDVFQDVSLLAMKKINEIRDADHLAAWLRKAARYECLKSLRKANRHVVGLDGQLLELLESEWGQYDQVETNDMIEVLRHCLGELTPRARRLVTLRYVDGLSGANLASHLEQKVHSVYVAVGRIHRTLRECMQRRMAGDSAP